MPKKIPERWEEYTPLGRPIDGTRFIVFKVPLSEKNTHELPEDQRFTPDMLLTQTRENGHDLGMIIDLTFTTRYYDSQYFKQKGLAYKKIFTAGKVVPGFEVQRDFAMAVDTFLAENADNEKLLGVHCTHGLNRTGYLVCRYMIDRLNIEPDIAISAFNEARGHCMERENYIADLKQGPSKPGHMAMDTQSAGKRDRRRSPKKNSYRSRETGYHNSNSYRGNKDLPGACSGHSDQSYRYHGANHQYSSRNWGQFPQNGSSSAEFSQHNGIESDWRDSRWRDSDWRDSDWRDNWRDPSRQSQHRTSQGGYQDTDRWSGRYHWNSYNRRPDRNYEPSVRAGYGHDGNRNYRDYQSYGRGQSCTDRTWHS